MLYESARHIQNLRPEGSSALTSLQIMPLAVLSEKFDLPGPVGCNKAIAELDYSDV
jgi:hypothetical protein